MKKLLSCVFGVTALILASCSSEEPLAPGQNGPNTEGDVYATLRLKLPTAGTRAGESANNGIEVGQDFENQVSSVMVILATKNSDGQYAFLTKCESKQDAQLTPDATGSIRYTLSFNSSELRPDPLSKPETGENDIPGAEAYVFVLCNPTENTRTVFGQLSKGEVIDTKFNEISHKDDAKLWQPQHFLMTNCEIVKTNIPDRATLITKHNHPEKAFNLGDVKVKRACARFDFATNNDNIYPIKDGLTDRDMGQVELTEMALFNIQKNLYYFPLVSDTWSWTTPAVVGGKPNYTLCGDLEGFVMSYNPSNFKNQLTLGDIDKYYFSYIIDNKMDKSNIGENGLLWTSIRPADWDKATPDDDEGWKPSEGTNYRIWRYCTENTIPALASGTAANSQRQGISTGVVFKGEFTPGEDYKQIWNGNVVYTYKNIVYGDLRKLREYVTANPGTDVATDYGKEFTAVTDENIESLLKTKVTGKDSKFKAYVPDNNGKYIMYYFYFNRHNTNNNNSLMWDNEFGVVRNNVYKLQVTKLETLGLPEAPNNPDKPNESEEAYFKVSCIVMPWTVRVNNIEF